MEDEDSFEVRCVQFQFISFKVSLQSLKTKHGSEIEEILKEIYIEMAIIESFMDL